MFRWPNKHWINVPNRGVFNVGFLVRAKWWPPFVTTEFLAPRYEVRVRNDGSTRSFSLQVAVCPFGGSLEDLPELPNQWRPVGGYRDLGLIEEGETKVLTVTIPTGLLVEGTHVVRLHLTGDPNIPPTPPYDYSGTVAWLQEYLRVEPLNNALTMLVAVGTFLLALATFALVLVTL